MPDSRSLLTPPGPGGQLTPFGTIRATYDSGTEIAEPTVEALDVAIAAAKAEQASVAAAYEAAKVVVRTLRPDREPLLAVMSRTGLNLQRQRDDHSLQGRADPKKYGRVSRSRKAAQLAFDELERRLREALVSRNHLASRLPELERLVAMLESQRRHQLKRLAREAARKSAVADLTRQVLAEA